MAEKRRKNLLNDPSSMAHAASSMVKMQAPLLPVLPAETQHKKSTPWHPFCDTFQLLLASDR